MNLTEEVSTKTKSKYKILTIGMVNKYLAANEKRLSKLSIGILLLFISPVFYLSLYFYAGAEPTIMPYGIGVFLVLAALGIFLCIKSNKEVSKYKYIKQGEFYLGEGVYENVESQQWSYKPQRFKLLFISLVKVGIVLLPYICIVFIGTNQIAQLIGSFILFFLGMDACITIVTTEGKWYAFKRLLRNDK